MIFSRGVQITIFLIIFSSSTSTTSSRVEATLLCWRALIVVLLIVFVDLFIIYFRKHCQCVPHPRPPSEVGWDCWPSWQRSPTEDALQLAEGVVLPTLTFLMFFSIGLSLCSPIPPLQARWYGHFSLGARLRRSGEASQCSRHSCWTPVLEDWGD